MISFDLSTTNILLLTAVVALFILFVTVLMKLNPSTETKEKAIETETKVEKQQPPQTLPVSWRNPVPATIETPKVDEKPQVTASPASRGNSVQVKQEVPAPIRSESKEIPKREKTMMPVKSESASSKKDCLHHYGYLRTLPKNAPIPDECFGCQKIVECLVKAKT